MLQLEPEDAETINNKQHYASLVQTALVHTINSFAFVWPFHSLYYEATRHRKNPHANGSFQTVAWFRLKAIHWDPKMYKPITHEHMWLYVTPREWFFIFLIGLDNVTVLESFQHMKKSIPVCEYILLSILCNFFL